MQCKNRCLEIQDQVQRRVRRPLELRLNEQNVEVKRPKTIERLKLTQAITSKCLDGTQSYDSRYDIKQTSSRTLTIYIKKEENTDWKKL